MTKNFLIITEGIRTEPDILETVFNRYGCNVLRKERIRVSDDDHSFDFDISELSEGRINIVIVQGPRNRIHDFLALIDSRTDDIERMFSGFERIFSGVFLVYDVDHTSKDELAQMFEKFCDESSGLLLLSSPCIEILSETEREDPIVTDHLKTYKAERNVWAQNNFRKSAKDYIIENFERQVIYYINRNCEESGSKNVMEHPAFVLQRINALNERGFVSKDVQPVIYRYFTTVLYVCVAYILGLTKEIENSDTVLDFFESRIEAPRT